jgi:ribosomal protein L16 Arg81 hydroxylase
MGSRTPTFAELVGDEDEFFTTYFSKRPLFRPGALAGDTREILSIADMDDIVHQEGLRSSLIRMLGQGGAGAAGPSLTRRLNLRREGKAYDDALAPEKIYAHFRAGKTLIHGGLNHTRPNLRALCAMLTEKFAAPSEAVAFLTPAGKQGSSPHSDPSDVYVIQLEGTKHWKVWPPSEDRRMGEDREFDLSDLPQPVLDIILRPGDALYIPYGTPHVATSDQEVSLHVTVVALTRTWSELLLPALAQVLNDHQEFWPAPNVADSAGDLVPEMTEKITALIHHLGRLDLAHALGGILAAGRAYEGVAQGHYFQEMATVDRIDDDTMVVGVPDSSTYHGMTDGVAMVTIHGNKLKMSGSTATALQVVGATKPFRAADFLKEDGAGDSVSSVKQLIRLGALRIA